MYFFLILLIYGGLRSWGCFGSCCGCFRLVGFGGCGVWPSGILGVGALYINRRKNNPEEKSYYIIYSCGLIAIMLIIKSCMFKTIDKPKSWIVLGENYCRLEHNAFTPLKAKQGNG